MVVLEIVIFVLALTLAYAWGGYYILLSLAAWLWGRKPQQADFSDDALPRISVLIAAYNESEEIGARVANLLAVDYPADKLHIYIGCDGCSDATARRAHQAADGERRVRVMEFAANRGKVSVLKDLVARARVAGAEADWHLLVFSDANTMFAPDALRKLVRPFCDAAVGGVCGRLVFVDRAGGENPAQEGAYWRMETKLKELESRLDSCLGANGAIYAIRPELFWDEIPPNTIVDDLVIGMKLRERGWRMLYDSEAIATEVLPAVADEWGRRVRIGAGDYQAAGLCAGSLHPRYGWFAWAFWSHKILRWFTPHMVMILLLIGSVVYGPCFVAGTWNHGQMVIGVVLIGVLALIVVGLLGGLLQRHKRLGLLGRIFMVANHFLTMNVALFVGFIKFMKGSVSGSWDRTPRGR
jgi:cellulose synthase/poly-beta-1,6-N-acetylglucosamine synthase-like glycosyltransferase